MADGTRFHQLEETQKQLSIDATEQFDKIAAEWQEAFSTKYEQLEKMTIDMKLSMVTKNDIDQLKQLILNRQVGSSSSAPSASPGIQPPTPSNASGILGPRPQSPSVPTPNQTTLGLAGGGFQVLPTTSLPSAMAPPWCGAYTTASVLPNPTTMATTCDFSSYPTSIAFQFLNLHQNY